VERRGRQSLEQDESKFWPNISRVLILALEVTTLQPASGRVSHFDTKILCARELTAVVSLFVDALGISAFAAFSRRESEAEVLATVRVDPVVAVALPAVLSNDSADMLPSFPTNSTSAVDRDVWRDPVSTLCLDVA